MKFSWIVEDEWLEWYRLTPAERWDESGRLWQFYISSGGSLETESDSQSPFDTFFVQREISTNGGAGMYPLRGSRIQP